MSDRKIGADTKDLQDLIARGLPLADRISRRLARQTNGRVDADDAIQMGRVGLIQAAQSYDPSHGVPFEAWMIRRVQGTVIDGINQYTGLSRAQVRNIARRKAADDASTGTHERLRYTMNLFAEPNSQEDLQNLNAPNISILSGEQAERLIEHHHISTPLQDPARQNDRKEKTRIARQMIDAIATQERELLQQHYAEERTFKDISKLQKSSRSWISRKHKRTLQHLHQQARVVLSLEMPKPHDEQFVYNPLETLQDHPALQTQSTPGNAPLNSPTQPNDARPHKTPQPHTTTKPNHEPKE